MLWYPKSGGLITSCICHGCSWSSLALEGKTSYEHYAAWYNGKTSGPASIHIDSRGPNGGGAIADPRCSGEGSTRRH